MRKSGIIVALLIGVLFGFSASAAAGNAAPEPKKSYDELWKSFTECLQKDLPESAAKTLDEIESKALKENNQTQLLKSWLMRSSVFYRTSENNPQQTYIRYLESKTGQLDAVHNALLHEEIAKEYAEFWRNWKWDIKWNLPIEGDVSKVEMKYWDEESFRSRIDAHFAEAIKPVEALKQAETKDFLLILNVSTKEVEKYLDYEKTLYEFMFHRMANLYMNKAGRDDVEEGMNSDNWWLPAKDFVNVELNGNADNPLIKCLKIYQELIAYHLESGNEDALIYNDFKRYGFVNSIFSDFNRFQIAMDDLRNRYADNPLSAEITALMANNLIDQYERKSSDSIYFDNYRKAKELCEQVIAKFPKTTGAENCQNLVKHIVEPKISLRMHEVQLPGEAIPAVLEYRNAFRPYYRIVKVSEKEVERLSKKNKEELLKELDSKPSVAEQELTLATETDYRAHKTLIAIPKLERGCYFLIAGTQKKIKNKEMRLALLFQVSSLGYIDEETEDNKLIVITVDRKTGKTVEGVTVEFYKENYRSQTNILATKQSDRNGRAEFTCKKNGIFIGFNLRKGDDCLYSFDNRKFYSSEESGEGIIGTHFFTDRAIYRPGQTVHFQGVVTRIDDEDKNVELVKGYTEIISLLDANRQEIASTEFVTDEYGSFSGSFVLPTDRMNGRYVLRSKTVLIYIRVEEYKRPTFEVNFEKPKEKYKLNEDVTIHGDVKAYAGFGLDDVECSYRVVRKTSFPWRCWWWNYPSVLDEQIASGKARTDENGKFAINFNLKPSQTIAPERQPLYTYEIEVTATSRQGETQTGTYSIRAGYNEIALSTDLPSEVEQSDMRKYKISVGNLSGEPAKSRILRKIYRCAEASKPNYFDAVFEYNNVKLDRQLLSDEELEVLFPNYSFYPLKGSAASNGSMTLLSQKQISVYDTGTLYDGQSLKPGVYVVELVSLDDSLANISKQFTVYEKESKKMPVNALVWAHADKQTANPGEKIQFAIGSSAKNVEIWVQLLHGSEVRIDRRITVSNSVQTIPYEVTENDRGALTWRYAMVKENSFRTKNVYVSVPFDNYDLDVKLATVRDRLNPGAEEKWEVTVRDYKDKPLEAALLAGMYDASLDVFVQNEWEFSMSPNISSYHSRWLGLSYFHTIFSVTENNNYNYHFTQPFNFRLPSDFPYVVYMVDGVRSEKKSLAGYLYLAGHNKKAAMNAEENVFYCVEQAEPMADRSLGRWPEMEEKKSQQPAEPTLRENFNETAFFFPQLRTNADGSATFSFTMPDALTRWRLMLLAYTKDRKTGFKDYTFTTSKPVMVMADMPRYLYDNDTLWFVANVINTGEEAVTPNARLEIFDAATMQPMELLLSDAQVPMEQILPGRSQAVRWKVAARHGLELLAFRFTAYAGTFSDAAQHLLPVLCSEVFMTQTLPLTVKANSEQTFNFDAIANPGSNERDHSLTLNFSSNPVWYAVQSLPYLANSKTDNAENAFYVFYANTLSSYIASKIPNMLNYIKKWQIETPEALQSQLEKDQDLKAIMLQETPWVLEAKSESEQRSRLAALFEVNTLRNRQSNALKLISDKQQYSGGWSWCEGMRESPYITTRILGGFGRLKQMGALDALSETERNRVQRICEKAVRYLENEVADVYRDTKKSMEEKKVDPKKITVTTLVLDELYALSFFQEQHSDKDFAAAKKFYIERLTETWVSFYNYNQRAKGAVLLYRSGNGATAKLMIKSFRECAQKNEQIGMYWPKRYYSMESQLTAHVHIMEAFAEIEPDQETMDQLRVWLLTQKRTNSWENSVSTADALYALLMRGSDWLAEGREVTLKFGNTLVSTEGGEAGTGFIQRRWNAQEVTPEMRRLTVNNPTNHLVWGGLFRQYFVPVSEVHRSDSGYLQHLTIRRELFVERVTEKGKVLVPIGKQPLKVGDKVTVRLTFTNLENMSYVFVKDLRAAGFEPIEQVSCYKYNDRMSYYQSNTDSDMEFFIEELSQGTHQLEYSLHVTKEGCLNNGYALIQCLYAPEFSACSDGMKVKIVRNEP